jgi:hypothetical protein
MRTGCWGEYLDRRGMKRDEVEASNIKRSFINFTLCQMKLK